MKIVVLDGATLGFDRSRWEELSEWGEVVFYETTTRDEALLAERVGDAEVVLTNKVPLSASLFEHARHLRHICVLATGFDVIDTVAARRAGVAVSNVAGYSTGAVAQHVWALILAFFHRVEAHAESVAGGDWFRSPTFSYWLRDFPELAGRNLGIIGYGAIGRRVAEIGHAFGLNLLVHSRREVNPPDWGGFRWVDRETVFAESDILSLHCPVTPETENLVDRERLAQMRHGALLVNTARGKLVDEEALAEALREGRPGGAVVDVLSSEPALESNPLAGAPNCLITPHMAWAAVESRERLWRETKENIRAGLTGEYRNRVD